MNVPWMWWIAFGFLLLAAVVNFISLIWKLKSQAKIKKLHDAIEKSTGEIIPLESIIGVREIIFNIATIVFFLIGAVLVLFWSKLTVVVAEWVFAVGIILFWAFSMGFSSLISYLIDKKQKRNKVAKIADEEYATK